MELLKEFPVQLAGKYFVELQAEFHDRNAIGISGGTPSAVFRKTFGEFDQELLDLKFC